MIQEYLITEWMEQAPWTYRDQVEQDLILARALANIYSISEIGDKLAFRGGTALNKLHLSQAYRYSEDLDFVQVRSEPIGVTIDKLRSVLDPWLGLPKRTMNEDLVKLTYKFTSSLGNTSKVKIEINTREHFLAEEIVSVPFEVNSRWFSGSSQITTLRLPALMGSKLRALYQRKKCRDLFDIVVVLTDGKVTSSQIVTAISHPRLYADVNR